MKFITNVLKENLENEEICMYASTIIINVIKCPLSTAHKKVFFSVIEPELLFDVLSRHHKIMKICEDISFILITLELYSIVLRLENKKDEEITKKLVTINGIMKTYKRS